MTYFDEKHREKIKMLEGEVTKRSYIINENSMEEEVYETRRTR